MDSTKPLSESNIIVLSSDLLPKIITDTQLLEAIQVHLTTTRSLRGSINAVLATFPTSEDEKAKLPLVLLLYQLSGFSVDVAVFCLSQPQLAGVASGSIKSQKQLAANVFAIPLACTAVPTGCGDAWSQLRRRLFTLEPTAVILGLARTGNFPFPDCQQDIIISVLEAATEKLGFNIAKESIRGLLNSEDLKAEIPGVHQDQWPVIQKFLFQLQRLQALVNEPQDIGALIECAYQSAEELTRSGDGAVQAMVAQGISEERAVQIRNHANVVAIRSEGLWTAALKARGTGGRPDDSIAAVSAVSSRAVVTRLDQEDQPPEAPEINLSAMFDLESMGCEDCASATGPAAYFVDLLHTLDGIKLRDPSDPSKPGKSLLSKLTERRPDLSQLELSCANTKVLIPYIDLVNELLESVLWNLGSNPSHPDSVKPFNMDDDDTCDSVIAQPRHINYPVYSDIVLKTVQPLNLFPYNQAIDSIRAYLTALGSSRYELLNTLQSTYIFTEASNPPHPQQVIDRALAAEALSLQHEDYVAICGEGFFDLEFLRTWNPNLTKQKYDEMIGLNTASGYWGFDSKGDYVSSLADIKGELLPRSGLNFQALLRILKAKYFNRKLAITSQSPVSGGMEFTGELKDMRLSRVQENGTTGPPDTNTSWQLQAFVRLWNKLQWSIEELDALAVCLAGTRTSSVDPQLLNGLAAVKQLAELSDFSPTELQPLWGDMNTHGPKTLYADLFLRGPVSPQERQVFQPDEDGNVLRANEKISQHNYTLTSALRISDTALSAIISATGLSDRLNLANLSLLYRVSLLCQILEISPADYSDLLSVYPTAFNPFEDPETTLRFVREVKALLSGPDPWAFDQLVFAVNGKASVSDNRYNFGVEKAVQVALSIFSNIKASGISSGDVNVDAIPEADLLERVHQVAEQLFGSNGGLSVSGFINSSPIKKDDKALALIKSYLTERVGSENADRLSKNIADANTTHDRQKVFLETTAPLMPKTRQQRIIVDSLKPQFQDLNPSMLQFALSDIVQVTIQILQQSKIMSGMDGLLLLADNTELPEGSFDGYFLPPTTDIYVITVEKTSESPPGQLILDGDEIKFNKTYGPWTATTSTLVGGRCYKLAFTGNVKDLKWATQQAVGIPPIGFTQEILVPEQVASNVGNVLSDLGRISTVTTYLGLEMSEIAFWQSSKVLDFNSLSLANIQNLQSFSTLKREFSSSGAAQPLIALYRWLYNTETANGSFSELLTAVTAWPRRVCQDFLQAKYPGRKETDPALLNIFKDVRALMEMRESLRLVGRLSIPSVSWKSLFDMASPHNPDGRVSKEFDNASTLRLAVDSRFTGTKAVGGGKSVLQTANDQIRNNSRNALIYTLLSLDYSKSNKLTDADSLFAFYLIDVQMGSTLQTTRIKQAISTVQLFVQRCMLGAEKNSGITLSALMTSMERIDWDYLLHYRLWEANRKAFLYPENWIEPTLRDDKSEQFMAIESAIVQLKLDSGRIKDLIQSYIHSVNEVADLRVESYLWDRNDKNGDEQYNSIFHFFGRTRTSPPLYYYRQLRLTGSASNIIASWSPWSKINVDVSVHEADADGKKLPRPGSYMIPAKLGRRLFVFLPEIVLGQQPNSASIQSNDTYEKLSQKSVSSSRPDRQWEIRLGFIDYQNGTWSPKIVSQSIISVPPDPAAKGKDLPDISSFKFWARTRTLPSTNIQTISVQVERLAGVQSVTPTITDGSKQIPDMYRQFLGEFEMRGQQLILVGPDGLPVSQHDPDVNTTGSTVPTIFSRLDWPVLAGSRNRIPQNQVYNGDEHTKPLLGTTTVNRNSKTLYTWTMAFDTVNNLAPTGFVFDVSSTGNIQSFFAFPPQFYDEDHPEDIVYTTEKFSNLVSPQLVNCADLSSDLSPLYKALSNLDKTLYHDAFGQRNSKIYNETSTPFAVYNWELGVHLPSLIMERLIATQQLDLALEVARLVFDPTADGDRVDRCWSFPPFRDELIRKGKGPEFDREWVKKMTADEWRASKYNVHAAARGNPVAYMKRIAMKYIEILIAAGDLLFRQNTLESLPLAIQRYTEASHVFGPPPVELPVLGKRAVKTYDQIAKDLDAFSNTKVDMELDFPFYSEPGKRGSHDGLSKKTLGFMKTTYFGVSGNAYLVNLRTLIDDRLYKIRNGMDINGNKRTLAIWEPPIDPGALARANASGGLSSLLAGLDGPMPKYRFQYILQRTYDLVGELKSSGQQMLSIREKKDAEALTALRSQHRRAIVKLSMRIEECEKKEVERAIDSLEEQRKLQEMQLQYYLDLTGDNNEIPQPGQSWQDIKQVIEQPTKDDFRMSPYEHEEMLKAEEAGEYNRKAGIIEATAAGLFALPTFSTKIQPFGVGMDVSVGGANFGQILLCASGALKVTAQQLADQGTQASRRAALTRQLQTRRLEANTIGRGIVKLDKDMEQLRARLATCDARMNMQQQDLENAEAEEQWLQNKYTSQQLYTMLESSLGSLFHQTYLLASEMAKKAQRALDFEHAMRYPNSNISQNGGSFLDSSLRDGHFLGEALFLDLKRLEAMHMDNRPHDLEIRKTVSLRQLDPWALLQLRESGTADFVLSEALFDMDFPGHYCRRIASVELSIPCVVGPYTSLNCTLSLQSHKYRITPLAKNADAYNAAADSGDDVTTFRTDRIPITSIAVGTGGMHESGTFEFDFPAGSNGRYERYGPFEGAGAISTWRIRLPSTIRPFDYDSISDVLLHVKYTALDGGEALGKTAQDALYKRLAKTDNTASVVAIDLRSDYADQWRSCTSGNADALLNLPNLRNGMLPFWTRQAKVKAETVALLVAPEPETALAGVVLETAPGGVGDLKMDKKGAPSVGGYDVLVSQTPAGEVTDKWKIKGLGGRSTLTRGWLVIGYSVSELK